MTASTRNETHQAEQSLSLLRFLPSVTALLQTETARELQPRIGLPPLTELARTSIEQLRADVQNGSRSEFDRTNESAARAELLRFAEHLLRRAFERGQQKHFQRVINATGVILHTNLGRAPLSLAARGAMLEQAAGYCSLEYDLETGARGRRGAAVEESLIELTGAEAALVVNNCAAATVLTLAGLGAGGEGIVSRGELVEIGGDFRIPDVMAQAGVRLIEVGTTNRTKLADYERAVGENTRLLVRVHPSNYRVVGFTGAPELAELAELAKVKNLLLYDDAGSGALVDLSGYGLTDEPIISDSIKAGADIVTFSADKLLGGCQAGLIVGKSRVIERLRRHPLYRALRVDKTAYAALAATLDAYRRNRHFEEIPVLRMIAATQQEIWQRAEGLIEKFQVSNFKFQNESNNLNSIARSQKLHVLSAMSATRTLNFGLWTLDLTNGFSAIGGGSAPLTELPTVLIRLQHKNLSAEELELSLRGAEPPIIARIAEDRVVIDLRTVTPAEENEILSALTAL